jgi:hypothetical protein
MMCKPPCFPVFLEGGDFSGFLILISDFHMLLSSFLWFLMTLVLLVLVQRWVHQHLHGVAYLLSGHEDMALMLYALPLLPGVALHELSHALMARLLRVQTANLTVVPRRQADGHVRLGSVQVERVDVIRGSLIGLAPLLAGSLTILLIIRFAFDVSTLGVAVQRGDIAGLLSSLGGVLRAPDAWLWLYLLFSIANAMMPSPSDRETWPPVILFSLLLLSLAVALGLNSALEGLGVIADQALRWLAAAFTITLIVDVPFVVIIFLLEATSGRALGRRVEYTSPTDQSSKKKKR